ncbi:phage tail tube protein [Nisaea sediminum]|uniref:phage tail tube protein n=1 Tax=Nisaea sediminum TaxID=2775867 RepID=UPI001868EA0C|nr:phage tail tube protein [Nisaea sediminum]
MATTGYFASQQTDDLTIGLAREATWGTPPASTYTGMRVQSISLNESKTRSRPNEIRSDRQASPAVTQDVSASGGLQFAISYGNQDLIWPTLFTGDWSTALAIADTGLSADNSGGTFDGGASDFDSVTVGQWIKVAGFDTAGANGYFRVIDKAGDGSSITVSPAPSTDANGGSNEISITGSILHNANVVNTLAVQERYSASVGTMFSGCIATGGQINAARGQFFSGTCDLVAKSKTKQTSVVGTMGAAPQNDVFNTVGNMNAIALGNLPNAKVNSITTTISRTGAGASYAIGDPAAIGVRPGSFMSSGQIELYFKDFEAYDAYAAETKLVVYYRVTDAAGNSYIVTQPRVVLGSETLSRGGPGQDVMATYAFEADPDPDLGWIMQIDRFPAAA